MSTATYLIVARSPQTGDILATLDTVAIKTLRYERLLNDVGSFQLTLPVSDERARSMAQKDTLIDFIRSANGEEVVEGTYIVRLVHPFQDEDEIDWLIVSGYSLEYLLLQRIIDPRNDPLMAGGYSTKSGAADLVLAELVNQQAGANAAPGQRVPYFTEQAGGGVGKTVGGRWAWESLLEVLQGLTSKGAVDFRITRTTGVSLLFEAGPIGEDRTRTTNYPGNPFVLFAPPFANIRNPDLIRDWRKEKTHIYLKGKGAGDNAYIFERQSTTVADTPYSYAAIVADARQNDDDNPEQFLTQAVQELTKHRAEVKFSFEVINAAQEYRVLWNLGDRVTARWRDIEEDMRITGIEVEVTDQQERITPILEVV